MTEIMIKILNMSILSSFIIIGIILLRALIHRAPKRHLYLIWVIPLLRLLLPFSFKTVFSIIPINTNPIPQNIEYMSVPNVNFGIAQIDAPINNGLANSMAPTTVYTSINPIQIYTYIGMYIWIAVMFVLIFRAVYGYYRLTKKVSTATRLRDDIYITDSLSTPFVMGIIRPRIYMPLNMSTNEMELVERHERMHIKRYDSLLKIIYYLACTIHWFNPLVWISYRLFIKDIETSCDEAVIKDLNREQRIQYADTLLSLAVKQSRPFTPLAFGESNTGARIKTILRFKKPGMVAIVFGIIILIATIFTTLSDPIAGGVSISNHKEFAIVDRIVGGGIGFRLSLKANGNMTTMDKKSIIHLLNTMSIEENPTSNSRASSRDDYYMIKITTSSQDFIPIYICLDRSLESLWIDGEKPSKSYRILRIMDELLHNLSPIEPTTSSIVDSEITIPELRFNTNVIDSGQRVITYHSSKTAYIREYDFDNNLITVNYMDYIDENSSSEILLKYSIKNFDKSKGPIIYDNEIESDILAISNSTSIVMFDYLGSKDYVTGGRSYLEKRVAVLKHRNGMPVRLLFKDDMIVGIIELYSVE